MSAIGLKVAVIGGGIAGLAVATALAQRGAQVDLFEQASEISEVGAGLQLSPNGTRVIHALGYGGALSAAGLINQAVTLKDHTGHDVLRMTLPQDPAAPFVLIHRAALIDLLHTAARQSGVQIHLGCRIDMSNLPEATVIIGADGLHSPLRALLNGEAEPFFTGQVAWRATVPDDTAPPQAHVFMGPGRHLVTYPLGRGLRNIVAVRERAEWSSEGWNHSDDPENLRRAFAGFGPQVQTILSKVETCNLWGLFRHPVAPVWQDGRVAILGDAAHPTLPFLAQGANLALEDAWVLADCLAQLPAAQALPLYQSRRHLRAARVISAANANARNYHLSGPKRVAAHTALRIGNTIAPNAALKRFGWLYDFDPTA